MKFISILSLLFLVHACSSTQVKRSKATDQSTRNAALQKIEPDNPEKKVVYLFRKKQEFTNFSMAVFIDGKKVTTLGARQFTRVELPYGKHFIQISFNNTGWRTNDTSAAAKRMSKTINVLRKPGPMLVQISTLQDVYRPNIYYYFKDREQYGNRAVQATLKAAQYTLPLLATIDGVWVTPGEKSEWELYANSNSVDSMNTFIQNNPDSPYRQEAETRREELIANEKEEYAAAQKEGTLVAMGNYLHNFPTAHNKHTVLKLMASRISKPASYNLYAETHPDIIQYYPPAARMDFNLMRIGPTNMQVKDILAHYKGGLGTGTLSAKIKATNAEYKDFSIKEIKHLKKRGVHEKLIEAMIESTAEHKRQLKMAQQNKAMMAQIQELIKNSQKNVSSYSGGTTAAGNNKNMPVECLKLKAALTACKQTGGLLALACESTARASFTCNVKI